MRHFIVTVITFLACWSDAAADIAPNPIVVNGIYTNNECKIRMESEVVSVTMSNDSAYVECLFEMLNHGDSVTIEVGFPVMNFHYFSLYQYSRNDKACFNIYVDGKMLSEDDIKVPQQLEEEYKEYMHFYTIDKQYEENVDSLLNRPQLSYELRSRLEEKMKEGNYPWYVWSVSFKKDERRYIKVTYSLPSGLGYGRKYRYFKYLLSTGAGWYEDIGKADVIIKVGDDIRLKNIEKISPAGYTINKAERTIVWNFTNIEPTIEHDIYIRYYNRKERYSRK